MEVGDYILQRCDASSEALRQFDPGPHVSATYNPLVYAREPWKRYLMMYCNAPKRAVFLGMNPGPWGMAQTGIPFGEIAVVRDWLGIEAPVCQPAEEHPKRPILGFKCNRSEVSGRRLWGLFRQTFDSASDFLARAAVLNYCPLVFMGDSGKNITPDKLPVAERNGLFAVCDDLLADALTVLQPEVVVGIGAFARKRIDALTDATLAEAADRAGASDLDVHRYHRRPRSETLLHPSPASPRANRGWAEEAKKQLQATGVWDLIVH